MVDVFEHRPTGIYNNSPVASARSCTETGGPSRLWADLTEDFVNSPALPSTSLFGGSQAVGDVEGIVRSVLVSTLDLKLTTLFEMVDDATGAPVEVTTAAISRMVDSGELTIEELSSGEGVEAVVTLAG